MNNYWLAIDQGGHASRTIVFDDQAKIVAQAERKIDTFTPKPDRVEHDASALLRATREAIEATIEELGEAAKNIRAAGLATQRSSIVCWNTRTGEALSPVISWQDRRQAQWLTQFSQHESTVHQTTGLFLSPHYGASKMRWCLDHIPAVQAAQQDNELAIGPLASFLAYQLVDEQPLVADPANASRTLLFNIHSGEWDDRLLELFGVPHNILPNIRPNQTDFGHLNISGHKIPLTTITGDQSAAIFAWGRPEKNNHYLNIGTGAFVQHMSDSLIEHETLLSSPVFQSDGDSLYTLEGTVNGAARALQWFADEFEIESLEQQLPIWLNEVDEPPLFINAVSGVGSPFWLPQIDSHFVGEADIPAKACAVVESIAFLLHSNMLEMPPAQQLAISGGLANLDGLCQRIANLTQSQVIRPAQLEATASGLAYLIAQQPHNWPGIMEHTGYSPTRDPLLEQRFLKWLHLMHNLRQ